MEALLGEEVPVGSISKELKKLWEAEGAGTRASLSNIAIYSEAPGSLERNAVLLQAITREHACRALLIQNCPAAGAPVIRAWIEAVCQIRGGKKSICSEQLAFQIEHGDASLVRNTVLAHLDSDLPLVFWWQGALSDRFEDRLYSVIDRLIVDTSTWEDAAAQFTRLKAAYEHPSTRFKINDLSWSRSFHLRMSLAKAFENPLATPHIQSLEEIRIQHGPGARASALMLAAWLGYCLKAEPTVEDGQILFTLPEGWRVKVNITEKADTAMSLPQLELQAKEASFSFTHQEDSAFIRAVTSLPGGLESEQLLPADRESEVELVLEQLERAGNNSLYFQMVPVLLKMLGVASAA